MDFTNLAFAKLNLNFDRDLFIKEYDEHILPSGIPTANGDFSLRATVKLNKIWGMVPEEEYTECDYFTQRGDHTTYNFVRGKRPHWIMGQLLYIDPTNITDPLLKKYALTALGPSVRNEGLADQYEWKVKPKFQDLKIVQWIYDMLPLSKINNIHTVSIEPGGFASIHRDSKGFYDNSSSAGVNRLYKNGYMVININITDGGVPLYWSFDGNDAVKYYTCNDDVYITNDYFMHGVPIVTSRRRQIRVTGKAKPEMLDIIAANSGITVPENYEFNPSYPQNFS